MKGAGRSARHHRALEQSHMHSRGGYHSFVLVKSPFPPPTHPPHKLLTFDVFLCKPYEPVCQESFSAFDSWPCRCCASSPFGLIPVAHTIKFKLVPLKKVKIAIRILESSAKVTVEQTYFNSSLNSVETTLVLPMPKASTIKKYAFEIDGEITAEGHGGYFMHPPRRSNVTLSGRNGFESVPLEQDDEIHNVFKCHVGNLPPRKFAKIKVEYTTEFAIDECKCMIIMVPKGFAPLQNHSTDANVSRPCKTFFEQDSHSNTDILISDEMLSRENPTIAPEHRHWLGLPFTQLSLPENKPVLLIEMEATNLSGTATVFSSSHPLTKFVVSEDGKKVESKYAGDFLDKSFQFKVEHSTLDAATKKARRDGCTKEITSSEWTKYWNIFCLKSYDKLSNSEVSPHSRPPNSILGNFGSQFSKYVSKKKH